jgi:hypothetical protein
MTYHEDFTLADLPKSIRDDLREAARATDVQKLPKLNAFRKRETD